MEEGGWFGRARTPTRSARRPTEPGEDERVTAVRTLLAEEARMGMMVGVAVGWALAERAAVERQTEQEE